MKQWAMAMASSVHWYDHVSRMVNGHFLEMTDFEVDGERKKGRPKKIRKRQFDEESMKVNLCMEDSMLYVCICIVCLKVGNEQNNS